MGDWNLFVQNSKCLAILILSSANVYFFHFRFSIYSSVDKHFDVNFSGPLRNFLSVFSL